MAFITPSPLVTSASSSSAFSRLGNTSRTSELRPVTQAVPAKHPAAAQPVRATAVQPNRPETSTARKQRQRKSAPVVDSRVATRFESHHWITVQNESRRIFERAAVAQVDLARQLEETQNQSRALHRWVLREIDVHPFAVSRSSAVNATSSRYLVTESFDAQSSSPSSSVTRRWLSAVERVGPLISSTIDIHSLQYSDVFTSKLHDVVFDPSKNIAVIHCLNLNRDDARAESNVIAALKAKAERSVSRRNCLEFCVLQSDVQPTLLKTIEIFADMEALMHYANGADKLFEQSIKPHIVDGRQGRYVFKPVVFS